MKIYLRQTLQPTLNRVLRVCAIFLFGLMAPISALSAPNFRQVVDLNGEWQVGQGNRDTPPAAFDRAVAVPGLIDMAQPPYTEVHWKSAQRQAFWYRRTFQIKDAVPAVATLKVGKATFGTKVWLNSALIGEHHPCFTAGYFNLQGHLKGGNETNEILIRIGADPSELPPDIPWGHDQEKSKYIAGIFDDVQVILSGTPNIVRFQTAPDITTKQVRVQALLHNSGADTNGPVRFTVREWKTGRVAGEVTQKRTHFEAGSDQTLDVKIPIKGCRLWSPDDPFLYTLEVTTSADRLQQRFGMRELRFNSVDGKAYLNGRLYYMRGSNVTLYRFFEDAERGSLPWDKKWVRQLHQGFKKLNWNSIRYCIGFPPEFWYDIADEEGILLQDEFPIWCPNGALNMTANELAREYAEHMQDHWNHPSVVIWDMQNESALTQTGQAIKQIRSLDISGRPWENGWDGAQAPGDPGEIHPYHFLANKETMSVMATSPGSPDSAYTYPRNIPKDHKIPFLTNEYGGMWLQRDGSPTPPAKGFYENILGPNSSPERNRELYAYYMAAETEFWRGHRTSAGVLHFCALGYSRIDGVTSDHFLDVKNQVYEPHFYEALKNSFAPVGLMIDYWETPVQGGAKQSLPVVVFNDLYKGWKGNVNFRLRRGGETLVDENHVVSIDPLGSQTIRFDLNVPTEPGEYEIQASLVSSRTEHVVSSRKLRVAQS
ncbi:hypothetical protein EON80_10545 [bacterium]|nr:MAG: hypothetical protein EON80_10545 [bacterium]